MTMITGDGLTYVVWAAWKGGLKACAVGMRVNRAYTPARLRRLVELNSGKKFKARDYLGMAAECEAQMQKLIEANAVPRGFKPDDPL